MVSNTVVAEIIGSVVLAVIIYYFRAVGTAQPPIVSPPRTSITTKTQRTKSKANSLVSDGKGDQVVPGGSDAFNSTPQSNTQDNQVADILASIDTAKSAKEKRKKIKKAKAERTSDVRASGTRAGSDGVQQQLFKAPNERNLSEPGDDALWTTIDRSGRRSRARAGTDTSFTTRTATEATSTESLENPPPEAPVSVTDNRRTLAEKLAPKVRKTVVDDMLEEGDKEKPIARVIRVSSEEHGSRPAPKSDDGPDFGASSGITDPGLTTDDDGFAVVNRSRHRTQRTSSSHSDLSKSKPATTSTEFQTKSQRKNQNKAAQRKAEKAAAQDMQDQRLAQYRKEQEAARLEAQRKSTSGSEW